MTDNLKPVNIDYTAMSGPQMLAACRDDASKWADAFMQHVAKHGTPDRDMMIGWFANAIEHSHDVRTGRGFNVLPDGTAFFVATVNSEQTDDQ